MNFKTYLKAMSATILIGCLIAVCTLFYPLFWIAEKVGKMYQDYKQMKG